MQLKSVRTNIFQRTIFATQTHHALQLAAQLLRGIKSKQCNYFMPIAHIRHLIQFVSCLQAVWLGLQVVNLVVEPLGASVQNAVLLLATLLCFTDMSSGYGKL